MSRSVINRDVVLNLITNACDVCLVKVKTGHRDQFVIKDQEKIGFLSSAIAAFPCIFEV